MTKRISLLHWPSVRNWKSMGDEKALCNKSPLQAIDSMIECVHRGIAFDYFLTHIMKTLSRNSMLWLVGSISINSWLAANNNSRGCVCEVWVFVIGWLVADRLEDTYWCVFFPSSQTEGEMRCQFPMTLDCTIVSDTDIAWIWYYWCQTEDLILYFYLLGPWCYSATFERLSCCVGWRMLKPVPPPHRHTHQLIPTTHLSEIHTSDRTSFLSTGGGQSRLVKHSCTSSQRLGGVEPR